jgi:hypothetical protein
MSFVLWILNSTLPRNPNKLSHQNVAFRSAFSPLKCCSNYENLIQFFLLLSFNVSYHERVEWRNMKIIIFFLSIVIFSVVFSADWIMHKYDYAEGRQREIQFLLFFSENLQLFHNFVPFADRFSTRQKIYIFQRKIRSRKMVILVIHTQQ